MTQPDRLRLAVFIDFDNIEIGVKNTLNAAFDAGLVLEALKERGEVVSKMAYSDWQRAGGYSRALTQHAIRMVQRNLTPGGDKNGADINLALDALEMAFTHPHINAFVIVGGDSDFISLVEKLKQYDKKVFVVGGRQFTSAIMQRNCHEFIAYENLVSSGGGGGRRSSGGRGESKADTVKIEQVIPLVRRALAVLTERDVTPQLGLLKSTLLQLDSTFSEKSFGAGSFREFTQKLEKAGVLTVHQGKGGWLVGPAAGAGAPGDTPAAVATDESAEAVAGTDRRAPAGRPMPETIGNAADGVRELAGILAAAGVRRWPLYLRNLKQIIKQTRPAFDERAYGFANLTDLARAAHREGVLRIERDRQGNVRMFQGTALPAGPAAEDVDDADDTAGVEQGAAGPEDTVVQDGQAGEAESAAGVEAPADSDHEPGDINGNVVDSAPKTTAPRAFKRGRPAAARKKPTGTTAPKRRPRARKKST